MIDSLINSFEKADPIIIVICSIPVGIALGLLLINLVKLIFCLFVILFERITG